MQLRLRIKKKYIANNEWLDWLLAFLLALAPVFQHYYSPLVNAGWTMWLAGFVLMIMRLLLKRRKQLRIEKDAFIAFSILSVYYLYHLFDHGFNPGNVITVAMILAFSYYFAVGHLNFKAFVGITAAVAVLNVGCLILQYVCYYLLHYNLQFVDLSKLVEVDYRWANRLSATETNLLFYRPSGLFLEPSHVFLFSFPVVLYYFTSSSSTKREKQIAAFLLAGILLSTSGMGVVFAIGMLIAYYVMFRKPKYKAGSLLNFFSPRAIVIFVIGAVILWMLYRRVNVVQQMFLRIFLTDSMGYNAISGRTSKGIGLLSGMSQRQRIIGISDSIGDTGKSISGYQGEMYKYGIIGILLSYSYYLFFLVSSRKNYGKYLAVVLLGISFVCAHTHRDFYMLYFGVFLFAGLSREQKETASVSDPYPDGGRIGAIRYS